MFGQSNGFSPQRRPFAGSAESVELMVVLLNDEEISSVRRWDAFRVLAAAAREAAARADSMARLEAALRNL